MAEGGAVALVPNRAARPILLRLAAKPETILGIHIREIQTGIRWCEKRNFLKVFKFFLSVQRLPASLTSQTSKFMKNQFFYLMAVAFSVLPVAAAELRIGIIGLDTSHCTEFTRRFNDANDSNYIPGGKVVAAGKRSRGEPPAR